MKPLTLKQAQKWLQKLKDLNPTAYRQLGKCLNKYQKSTNQYECFIKMNQTLYTLPIFAQQINQYMEQGNKFVINYPLKQRINSFLSVVKATKQQLFKQIIQFISKSATNNQINGDTQTGEQQKIIKTGIIEIVKKHPNLITQAQKAFISNQQLAIKKLDLTHLKNKLITINQQQDEQSKIQKPVLPTTITTKNNKKFTFHNKQIQIIQKIIREPTRIKTNTYTFLTTAEQKLFIKQLQKKIGTTSYKEIIKILTLYYHNIITHLEFLQLVRNTIGADAQALVDITQSRQISRRRNSLFKPLSDIDFHILPRQTHSYVEMPATYPHTAQNRQPPILAILNNKWVSVPRGSQETFNVRIKNIYELALNKCEDQRYQFDVVIKKFRKTKQLLEKVYNQFKNDGNYHINAQLNTIVSLGVLQIIYKNSTREQKDLLEQAINSNIITLIYIFLQRTKKTLDQLQQIKKLYATKIWTDISNKNFTKSLDFKTHEFKRYEKIKIRPQAFIDQLNERVQYLESRENRKINQSLFQEHKEFFSIFTSLHGNNNQEVQMHKQLPKPKTYNIKQHLFPTLLPTMILPFNDQQTLSTLCTYILFYIQSTINNDIQKFRCQQIFKKIMNKFFNITTFTIRSLNTLFNQQKFFSEQLWIEKKINSDITNWVTVSQDINNNSTDQNNYQVPFFNSIQDAPSQYGFEPPKNDNNLVFYSTENFYIFLRYLHILYERIIKMKQTSNNHHKIQLFEILYFACIKTKDNVRFEDSLNILFKGQDCAFLLTTIYKVIEGLCKTLNIISLSPTEEQSFSLLSVKNQEVYLLLLNRYMLGFSNNIGRLMRFTHEFDTHLVYINSFNPYYRFNQQNYKQYNKKGLQISKIVQLYNLTTSPLPTIHKTTKTTSKNNQQYYFQNNSYKLVNIANFQDLILSSRKPIHNFMKYQLQKIKKIYFHYHII